MPSKDLPSILNKYEIYILPSKYEPWGLVINESFACGKLALVSNEIGCIDDFREIIHEWMIFDPYIKDSLVKAILTAAKYENYNEYAKKASHFINDKWNYNHYETNLFKFLDYVDKKNNKTIHNLAMQWSIEKGNLSGRTAFQFVKNLIILETLRLYVIGIWPGIISTVSSTYSKSSKV